MAEGIARLLVDAVGDAIKVVTDGSDKLLGMVAKLRNAAGTIVNPATEDTLSTADGRLTTIDAVLDSIKDMDGVKKITDALPAGTNELGKVVLTDGDHDANISSSGKLEVSVGIDAKNVVLEKLLNGGSDEMAVDGDPTPVEFTWSPASSRVEGSALSFVIEDATIYFGDNFGGISELSNGVEIEIKSEDVVHTFALIKTTRELSQLANPGGFNLYSATPDHLKAELSIEGFIFMPSGTYTTDDYVKVTIQDDIDALSHMSCLFKGREVGS